VRRADGDALEATMRYRRLHYRYAVVLATERPRPLGDAWHAERPGVTVALPCWRPPADVYETADTIGVTVDLSGVEVDDLDIMLFEDALIVAGERQVPPPGAPGRFHAAEIRQGAFRLELALPSTIDPELADAAYRRGLLHVTLKKAGGGRNGG
jgi:HSP20 family protein